MIFDFENGDLMAKVLGPIDQGNTGGAQSTQARSPGSTTIN